ncbi:MAG TPA: cytochrome P450 [Rhodanobacteraceae bacterium]|nr:cytochrome P450 [Rhodanobacteraceae bacterium]
MRALVESVRGGHIEPPAECALQMVALHRKPDGELLAPEVAAVELVNLLRPTIAIARFMTFAALALHEHPQSRARLVDDGHYREAFVQEVRRFYPFFPAVAGIARGPFTWRGFPFHAGDRFIPDLYGTDHDARLWPEPEVFRPERFLDWRDDAFTLIPQGGGEHERNHRCAGEWLTVAVMKAMLLTLARDIAYDVPPQDLRLKLSRMPALPESGFMVIAGSSIRR